MLPHLDAHAVGATNQEISQFLGFIQAGLRGILAIPAPLFMLHDFMKIALRLHFLN